MQNLARSGTRRTVNVAVAEVPTIQQLDDAPQVRITQPARELRRGHSDLRELMIGEPDRRHVLNPPPIRKAASFRPARKNDSQPPARAIDRTPRPRNDIRSPRCGLQ